MSFGFKFEHIIIQSCSKTSYFLPWNWNFNTFDNYNVYKKKLRPEKDARSVERLEWYLLATKLEHKVIKTDLTWVSSWFHPSTLH